MARTSRQKKQHPSTNFSSPAFTPSQIPQKRKCDWTIIFIGLRSPPIYNELADCSVRPVWGEIECQRRKSLCCCLFA
ncbi:hypothetical protein B8V81_3805 [Paenibacillus pasadenensis]|uniref:Uncharacterized protein n=1 Tax=Paenibacillus pasadenensis TaxID=217090 RepID=A0A2N5N4U2_9BACL|nr:hypothetical protein B8V81_3805 [Paenibacillus pasadenensis]